LDILVLDKRGFLMRVFVKSLGIIALVAMVGFGLFSCVEPEETPLVLTGTVSISGTAQVGQTLTADTSTLGGSGVITFQWMRGGNVDLGNNGTYTIRDDDIGSTITVTVSRSDRTGSVISPAVGPVPIPILSIADAILTVSVPGTGAIPNVVAGGSGNFTLGAVSWYPVHTSFQPDTEYTATIILTANEYFTFANGLTGNVSINGNPATPNISNNGRTAALSHTFMATDLIVIENVAITLAAPSIGESPDTMASGTGNFTIYEILWNPNHILFQGNTVYTVTITLKANAGYMFADELYGMVSINGLSATVTGNTGSTVTLSKVFSATDHGIIPSAAITVTAPVIGATPNTTANGEGNFTVGSVSWNTTQSTFQGGTVYTAIVILTAYENYTFTGGLTGGVTVNGASVTNISIAGDGRTATLSHTFTATQTVIQSVVINTTAPVRGAIPSSTASGASNFSVSAVSWDPADNPFQGNTVYTATIILTANANFSFIGGLTENVTVNGVSVTPSIASDGRTATLLRTFDATARTPIPNAAITVTAPITSAMPVTTAGGIHNNFTSTVSWDPSHSSFQGGIAYTVTITLTADENFTFSGGLTGNVTINGFSVMPSIAVDGRTAVLSRTFAETAIITWTANSLPIPAIIFNFGFDPGAITASDVTIVSGTGTATGVSLTGTGTMRKLTLTNVSGGTVTVSINRAGISNVSRTVILTLATVSAGEFHSVAVIEGKLWTWGLNSSGQLGDGTTTDSRIPVWIDVAGDWVSASAGDAHTVAITTNGELWAWGNNSSGQLGDGTTTHRLRPVRIGTGSDWASVSAGGAHTVAIRTDGMVWAWGNNSSGQVGDATTTSRNGPTRVQVMMGERAISVSAGGSHTVAVTESGRLRLWGNNSHGQLGNGTTVTPPPTQSFNLQWGVGVTPVMVAAGRNHTVVMLEDNNNTGNVLQAWGDNSYGQLGDGTRTNRLSPVQINSVFNFATISAGNGYTVGVRTNGELRAWGRNNGGDGTTTDHLSPVRIGTENNWASASAGGGNYWHFSVYNGHTVAVTRDGGLWAWGFNNSGQLGDNTTTQRNSPVRVIISNWASVSAGREHTVAITRNGELWAWGQNDNGRLGDGTDIARSHPVRIQADRNWRSASAGQAHTAAVTTNGELWQWGSLGNGRVGSANNWAYVSSGFNFTVALTNNGELWAWGFNNSGQLGDGTTSQRSSPVRIGTASNWASVSAGFEHTVALTTNGQLWAWGRNTEGQLGNGAWTNSSSPVRVGTASNWASVSAGGDRVSNPGHTVAVTTNGELFAWGNDWGGQLGLGGSNRIDRNIPQRIGFDNNWVSVSAGSVNTLAIRTNGELWAWGGNNSGALGDGTTFMRTAPVRIGDRNSWAFVYTGSNYTVALTKAGELLVWGNNQFGQLGDGTTTQRTSPVRVGITNN
jgi:alpha-tubulin suppressor-like RCC1 family protein